MMTKHVNDYKILEKYRDFRMQPENTHPIARHNSESCNAIFSQHSRLTISGMLWRFIDGVLLWDATNIFTFLECSWPVVSFTEVIFEASPGKQLSGQRLAPWSVPEARMHDKRKWKIKTHELITKITLTPSKLISYVIDKGEINLQEKH